MPRLLGSLGGIGKADAVDSYLPIEESTVRGHWTKLVGSGSFLFMNPIQKATLHLPSTRKLFWILGLGALTTVSAWAQIDPVWENLSSKRGELPTPPGGSTQQTGAVVADFDGDGLNDFILSFREKAPALVLYRRTASGWDQYVIEKDYLTVEAGGAVCDIDGDGNLDVVFGGDWQSGDVWWWENPGKLDPNVPWKRHYIKKGGAHQHHDQVFGDFLGTGKPQLVFWNQDAKTLYLAEIPQDPRNAETWALTAIATNVQAATTPYTEGISAFDVDGDGKLDILAYNAWYKHIDGKNFKRIPVGREGGLIFAGYLKESSKIAQIVISPGDGQGPLRWYECTGNPEDSQAWTGHDLLDRIVVHGHSLQLGDVNRDGHLDIFVGEMAKWSERQPQRDNPEATAWIFYGDGKGNFRKTEVVVGHGWHEGQLADLDGDGDLDLLNKPYNWDTPRVDVWLNNGTRGGAKGVGTSRSFGGPVGLQLYSLRDTFSKNIGLGLQFARNFGFREVELAGTYGMPPAQFAAALDRFGLKPISGHWDYNLVANDIEKVVAEAKALGVQYVGVAWIPHDGPFTEELARKAAGVFNRAGERLAREKITFFYHNHGYEFVPTSNGTLFDLLMAETKPEFVSYEMDIFWTVHPGQNPVDLLRKYPNRWVLMHAKDMRKGTKTGLLTGSEDVRNDVPLGSGQIDIPAVFQEGAKAGVKHYFIEDESPTPVEQIPQSIRYLESLAW